MPKENNLPKISIVMPSFNSSEYIEDSIKSVISQNYPNLELFIKDGGSTDKTVQIIEKYAKKYPKIISWVSKKDKGQTDAINYGLKNVTGEITAYLNSDDIYKEGTLSKVADFFKKNPQVSWLVGKCDIIDSQNKVIMDYITQYKNFWLLFPEFSTLLILNYISQMAVFWKAKVHKEVGYFDIDQHYVMDYEFWLRLWKKYQPGFLGDYLASFRITPKTKSSTGFKKQFADELTVAKKYTDNQLILGLHYLHIKLIVLSYDLLK